MGLEPAELLRIADIVADAAEGAGLDLPTAVAGLNLRQAHVDLQGAPRAVWHRILRALSAGVSREAGDDGDAGAFALRRLEQELPGNRELRRLLRELGLRVVGPGAAPAPGQGGVFISYQRGDEAHTQALCAALEARLGAGRVFLDTQVIRLGDRWLDVLRREATSASVIACWVTDGFLASAYTSYEVGLAEARGARVVPLIAERGASANAPDWLTVHQGLPVADPPDYAAIAAELAALVG